MTKVDIEQEDRDTRLFQDATLQDRLKRRINLMLATDVKRKREVHVTDLIFLRKGYFAKVFYEPLTDPELGYFVAGRGHHAIIQALRESNEIEEVPVSWKGVVGSVDLLGDAVIEFKTTRVRKVYTVETVPSHWMEQLGMYVSMVHPNSKEGQGILFVLYLMTASFHCYRVTFENLPAVREKMEAKAGMLRSSVAAKSHLPLPLCPEWMCSEQKCKWYTRCGPPPVIQCPNCRNLVRKGSTCACTLKSEYDLPPSHPFVALPHAWRPKH